jgi:phytoene dehydrogenase-like protein
MNRRELLASFLGLPLALSSGCGAFGSRLPPAGEIIGASAKTGHRIRDGFRPQPATDGWSDVDVVIVGGGIAGLSAARKLARTDLSFVLLELESRVGGTSIGGQSELVAYPWGAHYVPVPHPHNRELIELLDDVGILEGREEDGAPVVAEQFLCRDPHERLFIDGAWHPGLLPLHGAAEQDVREFAAFRQEVMRWVAWRDADGRRAFTLPISACSDDAEVLAVDRQSMSDWIDSHGWKSSRLRWYVDLCCRDDYGLTIDQTSAWAGLFYFASRVRNPGQESEPFITWPEGNARLVRHLREISDDHIRTGLAVTEILAGSSSVGARTDVVAFRETAAGDEVLGWHARKVIFAAPTFLAPYLIQDYRADGPSSASELTFGSWLVANLHLSDRPAQSDESFPLSWDNTLFDSPSLGYVCATHQRLIDHGPTVFTYYYPLCDDDPKVARQRLLSLSWEEWSEVILSDLERAHPDIRSLCDRLDIMRWGHAMVRPVPGLISGGALTACRQPFRDVHFAHSSLSGIALFEEAFDHGNRAAVEVIAALAPAPQLTTASNS